MGAFRRFVGLDIVDTALHLVVTVCAAAGASQFAGPVDSGGAVAAVFAASAIWFGIRRRRGLAELPAERTDEVAAERLHELEARVAELELGQLRMQELEERLDFAERLLAKRVEPLKLEES